MIHKLNLFGEGHLSVICIISCKVYPLRFLKGRKYQTGKQPLESLGEEIVPHFPLIKTSNDPKEMSEDLTPLGEFHLGNLRVWADRCISVALQGPGLVRKYGLFSGAE